MTLRARTENARYEMTRRHARPWLASTLPALVAAVVVTACGGSSQTGTPAALAAAQPCGGVGAGAVTVAASSYVMSVVLGPVEAMYSPADVGRMHPAAGEVMLRGTMVMQPGAGGNAGMTMSGDMSGMNMNGPTAGGQVRHLEVHICTASGSVVTNANPSIRLRDTTDGVVTTVPIAVMQGVTSGTADLHYGNNVSVTLGDTYFADIAVNGATASVRLAPA